MSLTAGTRLGPYEVVSALGAGGMGEVYRARDSKLGREVALKVVSESFTYDPERVARFHREAQLLASLNHPHIASIYGFEESTEAQFLVMELVEGGTLAERLKAGPIPIDEALAIARQVADALQAAHEKGIIHRDLKPANVALTADGQVKVLDFGLAKALEPADIGHDAGHEGPRRMQIHADLTHSPTLSLAATQAGVILGTAAYMAPEQAKGRPADKRSDIWAFGCVLYEMFAGKRAFEGEDASDTMAAVLRADVDWGGLPADMPPSVAALIKSCLLRDRTRRVGDFSVVLFVLDHLDASVPRPSPEGAVRTTRWRSAAALVVLTLAAAAIGAASAWMVRTPAASEPVLFTVETPPTASPASLAISPDGRHLAFTARDADGRARLWVRPISSLSARVLPGSEEAALPFWSPDSRSIAFFTSDELRRIDLNGGPPQRISRTSAGTAFGGTWSAHNVILFSRNGTGILRVSAAGGQPEALTTIDAAAGETNHAWPEFLPDGDHFVYLKLRNPNATENSQLVWRTIDGSSERVVRNIFSKALYSPTGHLLFRLGGPIFAQSFDSANGIASGDAIQIAADAWAQNSLVALALSPSGLLAYRSGQGEEVAQLTWLDRGGKTIGTAGAAADFRNPFLDPSSERITANSSNPSDVWLFDSRRGTSSRVTFDANLDSDPVFSADGRWIAFYSSRQPAGIYRKASSGAGADELMAATGLATYPRDWSADGRFLTYDSGAGGALWVLPAFGDRKPVRFPPDSPDGVNISQGHFAPDTKWIAYTSSETGRAEVFVQDFPSTGAKYQVSVTGGSEPRWRRDGRELFFLAGDGRMMAVDVALAPEFRLGIPRPLFQTLLMNLIGSSRRYGVTADGSRFILNVPVASDSVPSITVALNWQTALQAR